MKKLKKSCQEIGGIFYFYSNNKLCLMANSYILRINDNNVAGCSFTLFVDEISMATSNGELYIIEGSTVEIAFNLANNYYVNTSYMDESNSFESLDNPFYFRMPGTEVKINIEYILSDTPLSTKQTCNILKREIFDGEFDDYSYILSYHTDYGLKPIINGTHSTKARLTYAQTIALTSEDGSSYMYPRTMVLEHMQVYPPIIEVNPVRITGTNSYGFNVILAYGISTITEKTYLFPETFNITYKSTYNGQNHTTFVPSFGPNQNNNNQWAYMIGNNIYIKDPTALKKKIISGDAYQWTQPNNNFYDFGAYYAEFRVSLNKAGVPNILKNSYNTTLYPISYNVTAQNVCILRRQMNEGKMYDNDNPSKSFFRYTTSRDTSNSTYYSYRYYYKGQEITDLDSFAYIMPRIGHGSTKNGNNYSGGIDPTYFFRNANRISSPTSPTFTWTAMPEAEEIVSTHPFYNFSYHYAICNMYLIKVNGNENMKSFGQWLKYYNHHSVDVEPIWNDLSDIYKDSAVIKKLYVHLDNGFDNHEFIRRNSDETHVEYSSDIIKNSEIIWVSNSNSSAMAAGGIRHAMSNYLGSNISNRFKCISYYKLLDEQYASDLSDLNVTFNTRTHNGLRFLDIDVALTVSDTFKSGFVSYVARNSSTYTYCYIAADVIAKWGSCGHIITNTVLSDTYLCIKSFSGNITGGSGVTYNIHIAAMDEQ